MCAAVRHDPRRAAPITHIAVLGPTAVVEVAPLMKRTTAPTPTTTTTLEHSARPRASRTTVVGRGVAQVAERGAHNAEVAGSRPVPASTPPRVAPSTSGTAPGGLLRRIGGCESSGSPTGPLRFNAENSGGSGASGAYQMMDGTWRGWAAAYGPPEARQYRRARMAPPDLQTAVAGRALAAQGTRPWASSRACWR